MAVPTSPSPTRLQVDRATVERIRQRFAQEGLEAALFERKRSEPPVPAKLDGAGEAHLSGSGAPGSTSLLS